MYVAKNTLHGANVRAYGACAERSEILLKKLTCVSFLKYEARGSR